MSVSNQNRSGNLSLSPKSVEDLPPSVAPSVDACITRDPTAGTRIANDNCHLVCR